MKRPLPWIILSFIAFSVYLFLQIQRYSVDLFTGDLWHVVQVALDNRIGFWEGFAHQHGPHRMGLAYVMISTAFSVGIYSAKIHAFAQGVIWLLSGLLAMRVMYKWRGKYMFADAIIPPIFLFQGLLMTAVSTPYIHGFTVFLAMVLMRLQFSKKAAVRIPISVFVLICAAYTFNSNIIVIGFFLFAVIRWWKERKWEYAIYVLSIISLGIFMALTMNFQQGEATMEASTSLFGMMNYAVELMTGFAFYQAHNFVLWIGLVIAVLMMILWVGPMVLSNRSTIDERWILIFSILIYWGLNSFTRWSSGPGNAHAARYLAMVPLVLFTLYWSASKWNALAIPAVGVVALFVLLSWNTSRQVVYTLRSHMTEIRTAEALLKSGDYKGSSYKLHPFPERVDLENSLRVMGYLPD